MQTTTSRATHRCSRGCRGRTWSRRIRRRALLVAVVMLVGLALPVPWLQVMSENPPGHAWRLDGRLHIEGEPVDPGGSWSWLAVGRPPVVGELIRDRLMGNGAPPMDMRRGPRTRSPALSEPAAVAVGLRHAGHDLPMRLLVEASLPHFEDLPDRVVITEIEGIPLNDRRDWDRVVGGWEVTEHRATAATAQVPRIDFAIRDGRSFSRPGSRLPYDRVDILDLAPVDLEAGIAGPVARLAPVSWFRNLSLGSSHGMMVALLAYTHGSGHDIAQSRHIAGTGGIQGDGTITRIGGLPSKARAAKRAGADVLLVPSSQVGELESFDRQGITLVPVETLDDAIRWLANPVA